MMTKEYADELFENMLNALTQIQKACMEVTDDECEDYLCPMRSWCHIGEYVNELPIEWKLGGMVASKQRIERKWQDE